MLYNVQKDVFHKIHQCYILYLSKYNAFYSMLTACTIAAFCTCINVQTNLKTEFFFAMKLDFQTREHCDVEIA